MGPARIYPWRRMHPSRAPSIAPGTFFVAQSWAGCITNMPGFNLRQATLPHAKALVRRDFEGKAQGQLPWEMGGDSPLFPSRADRSPLSFGFSGPFKKRRVQTSDFRHRLAGDRLQVAHHANRGFNDCDNLGLTLCPLAAHEFAFLVEILAHVVEFLDDGIDPLAESDAR